MWMKFLRGRNFLSLAPRTPGSSMPPDPRNSARRAPSVQWGRERFPAARVCLQPTPASPKMGENRTICVYFAFIRGRRRGEAGPGSLSSALIQTSAAAL